MKQIFKWGRTVHKLKLSSVACWRTSLLHSPSWCSLQHSLHSLLHDDLATVRAVPPRQDDCWAIPENEAALGSGAPRAETGTLMESCAPRVAAAARAEVAARTEIATMNLHEARTKFSSGFISNTGFNLALPKPTNVWRNRSGNLFLLVIFRFHLHFSPYRLRVDMDA